MSEEQSPVRASRPAARRPGIRLYVILSRPTARAGDRDAVRAEHFAYIHDLEARGVLFAAGPEVDENDKPQGPGIIIIRAASLEAARAIADAEPFHRDRYREYDIRSWRISEGGFGLRVRFTERTFEFE